MATWAQFAAAAPGLAEHGERLVGVGVAFTRDDSEGWLPARSPFHAADRWRASARLHRQAHREVR